MLVAEGFPPVGSVAAAAEMCIGAGVGRKRAEGVMFPAFQATRDEKYSTRGRVNAMRSAMMGLLTPQGMTLKELYGVPDLRHSRHAWRSEGPSAVDMAKINAEFLYQYRCEHGVSLRSRVFENIARLNRLAQAMVRLSNALLTGPGKWVLKRLGLHPKKQLLRFTRQPISRRYLEQDGRQGGGQAKGPVEYLHDTFRERNHPEIGKAAIKVLDACAYPAVQYNLMHTHGQ